MRKAVITLGLSVLALTGCGERTLAEAEVRADGPVAEDHNAFWHGPCDFETKYLVIDMEDSVWLDRHAPICQDKGNAELNGDIPFVSKMVLVPAQEVEYIPKVTSVDPEQFVEIRKIKVGEW